MPWDVIATMLTGAAVRGGVWRMVESMRRDLMTEIRAVNGRIDTVNGRIDAINGRIDAVLLANRDH